MLMFTFFVSDQKCPFLGKFGPKYQNCQFKAKFASYSNSNMQNSKMVFTFFVFDWKRLFLDKFGLKSQNN